MKEENLIRNYKPALLGSLKVAKDLQLFEKWYKQGDTPRTSEELTAIVSCDGILLRESYISRLFLLLGFLKRTRSGRLLRHLTATNVLQEVSPGTFKQTSFSISLLQPVFGAWIDYA